MSTLERRVCYLVDSAASSKLKRLKGGETFGVKKPGGEARIYIGQESDQQNFDDFFGFDSTNDSQTFKVNKADLLEYLLNSKNEFEHSKQKYRLDISMFYNDFITKIISIKNDIFDITFKRNIDKKRYYLSPEGNGGRNYKDNIRQICLPLHTVYNFIKSIDDKGQVSYFFKPVFTESSKENNLSYKKCTFSDTDISPIILYGPPGTGKTYRLQNHYLNKFDVDLVFFTTFHQSFSYEEFVEGLKPSLGESDNISYNIEKGVFYNACEQAAKLAGFKSLQDAVEASMNDRTSKFNIAISDKKLVLLCIDEINRGNVASIFGDLISLIEPSKRLGNKNELILTLPYSKERFGVPSNLVIVGTMNTADRSIQLLDSALRRRFRFEELPPVVDTIANKTARDVLRAINNRVRAILSKDAQIGHAYFIDVTKDEETIAVIAKKVIPLLEEYFYNDIDKIRFVLNDYGNIAQFYLKDIETQKAYEYYIEKTNIDPEEKNFFFLNPIISSFDGRSQETSDTKGISASDFLNQIIG